MRLQDIKESAQTRVAREQNTKLWSWYTIMLKTGLVSRKVATADYAKLSLIEQIMHVYVNKRSISSISSKQTAYILNILNLEYTYTNPCIHKHPHQSKCMHQQRYIHIGTISQVFFTTNLHS